MLFGTILQVFGTDLQGGWGGVGGCLWGWEKCCKYEKHELLIQHSNPFIMSRLNSMHDLLPYIFRIVNTSFHLGKRGFFLAGILLLLQLPGYSQNTNFEISVSRKTDAYPFYLKNANRYNLKYINPTGYIIGIKALESKRINDLREKIAFFEKQNKPTEALERRLEALLNKEGLLSTQYSIEGVGNNFRTTVTAVTEVPKKGIYKITGEAKYKNGKTKKLSSDVKILDHLIVVLGDSYISGEGNPDKNLEPGHVDEMLCKPTTFRTGMPISNIPNQWQESNAHRSYNNGAYYASERISRKTGTTHRLVRFVSFARSGAKIIEGLIGPNMVNNRDGWIQMGQIDEAIATIGSNKIDALILSISGNDVAFASSLEYLVIGDTDARNDTERKRLEKKFDERLRLVPSMFEMLNQKLNGLSIRNILICEYPVKLFESSVNGVPFDGNPCGIFLSPFSQFSLEKEDGVLFKKLGGELNRTIESAAKKYGWKYVTGINDAFSGHGYCAPETYYVGAEESCKNQDDVTGVAHPNKKGQKVIGDAIYKHLKPLIDKLSTSIDGIPPVGIGGN